MRHKVLLGSLAVLLASMLLWAGEPWKDKPPAEWTKNDVEEILNESPWVKTVVVTTSAGFPGGVTCYVPPGYDSTYTICNPVPPPPSGGPTVDYRVFWLSSSVMQQAVVRARELAGQPPDDGLAKFLSLARGCHLIGIGPSMDLLSAPGPLILQKPSKPEGPFFLKPGSSNKEIAAVAVAQIFAQGHERERPTLLVCFPREVDGRPLIGPQEKKARVRVPGVDVVFDLSEMVRDGKPDL